jgi:hypothetical protein
VKSRTALLSLLLASPALGQINHAWQSVGTAGFSPWATICSRITSDASGNVYVAYQDLTPGLGARISVMQRVGDTWHMLGTQGAASVGAGYYCNMAFDAQGALLVAARDYGHAARAGVRRFDFTTNTWTTLGAAIGSAEAHWVDLVVAPDGKPCVAYSDHAAGNRATAMRFDAGAWTPIGSPGFSSVGASFEKITAAPDGTLYAAYSDHAYPDAANVGKCTVMRFDPASSTWSPLGTPGFSAYGANNLTLAIDRAGVPWIAYYRYHDAIIVQRFDGTNWVTAGGSPTGADVPTVDTESWRQWLSLQFDSQNRPYIAYQLYYGGGRAVVRRFENNNDWVVLGQWGFTPGAADYLSMIVDAQDVPWVVYRDGAYGQRISVMRYVPVSGNYCTPTLNSLGGLARMSSTGAPSLTGVTPFTIRAGEVVSQSIGLLVWGVQPDQLPFGTGTLCINGIHRAGTAFSGGAGGPPSCTGVLQYEFGQDIANGLPGVAVGTHLFAQFWYRDLTSPTGFAMSDGLQFVVGP